MTVRDDLFHVKLLVAFGKTAHLGCLLDNEPVEYTTETRLIHIFVSHQLTKVVCCLVRDA